MAASSFFRRPSRASPLKCQVCIALESVRFREAVIDEYTPMRPGVRAQGHFRRASHGRWNHAAPSSERRNIWPQPILPARRTCWVAPERCRRSGRRRPGARAEQVALEAVDRIRLSRPPAHQVQVPSGIRGVVALPGKRVIRLRGHWRRSVRLFARPFGFCTLPTRRVPAPWFPPWFAQMAWRGMRPGQSRASCASSTRPRGISRSAVCQPRRAPRPAFRAAIEPLPPLLVNLLLAN